MSRGLSFFRLPEEEEFFLRLITSVRDTVVFPILRAPSRKELAAVPVDTYLPKFQPGTMIALASPDTRIHVQRSAGGRRFTILATRSQVLKYWIGRVHDGSCLGHNRLEFASSYVDDKLGRVHFASDFLKWGDKVRRLIRDNTVEWKNRRWTKNALQAIKEKRYTF